MSEPREVSPVSFNRPPTNHRNSDPVAEPDESKQRRIAPFVGIQRGQDSVTGDADVRFADFTPVPFDPEAVEEDAAPKAESAPEPASSEVSEVPATEQTDEKPTAASPASNVPPPLAIPAPAPAGEATTPPSPSDDLLPGSSSVKKIG